LEAWIDLVKTRRQLDRSDEGKVRKRSKEYFSWGFAFKKYLRNNFITAYINDVIILLVVND
jgi:hypothetical protein